MNHRQLKQQLDRIAFLTSKVHWTSLSGEKLRNVGLDPEVVDTLSQMGLLQVQSSRTDRYRATEALATVTSQQVELFNPTLIKAEVVKVVEVKFPVPVNLNSLILNQMISQQETVSSVTHPSKDNGKSFKISKVAMALKKDLSNKSFKEYKMSNTLKDAGLDNLFGVFLRKKNLVEQKPVPGKGGNSKLYKLSDKFVNCTLEALVNGYAQFTKEYYAGGFRERVYTKRNGGNTPHEPAVRMVYLEDEVPASTPILDPYYYGKSPGLHDNNESNMTSHDPVAPAITNPTTTPVVEESNEIPEEVGYDQKWEMCFQDKGQTMKACLTLSSDQPLSEEQIGKLTRKMFRLVEVD